MRETKEGYIDYSRDNNSVYRVRIDNHDYGFSVDSFPRTSHSWLVEVLNDMVEKIHKRSRLYTKVDIKHKFDHLFD